MTRLGPLLPALLTLGTILAGCVGDAPPPAPPADTDLPPVVRLGTPIGPGSPSNVPPLSLIEAQDAGGNSLWFASTDLKGAANLSIGADVARVLLWNNGSAYEIRADGSLLGVLNDPPEPLVFAERVEFPNPTFPLQFGTTCLAKTDGDVGCGLDEPSVVVDARGWIYFTAACCFLVSSPVFVSQDNGTSFRALANPFKDAYGNEGDLAIDDEGNLYYMDIDLATFGIARWNPDLSSAYGYRRPGQPVVDRPWIRAGSGGVVYAIYNTGIDTVAYRSTDYALTFSAAPVASFGSGLARAYSDVQRDIVGFVGGGVYMESSDEGVTWGGRTNVENCPGADTAFVDEVGTAWFHGGDCVAGRRADGTWTQPSDVIPNGIEPFMTWMGAGGDGAVAVAYYGRVTEANAINALRLEEDAWYLFLSFSNDADSANPHWATLLAEPEPIGYGSLGRALGDFLQVYVGPDGAIHLAYAMNPEMDDSATAVWRGTSPLPSMAPGVPLVGPFES